MSFKYLAFGLMLVTSLGFAQESPMDRKYGNVTCEQLGPGACPQPAKPPTDTTCPEGQIMLNEQCSSTPPGSGASAPGPVWGPNQVIYCPLAHPGQCFDTLEACNNRGYMAPCVQTTVGERDAQPIFAPNPF